MADEFGVDRTATQYIDTLVERVPDDHEGHVPAITVLFVWRRGNGTVTRSSISAEAGYVLQLTRTKRPMRIGKRRTTSKRGPVNPPEAKIARQKEIQYLWDRGLYEYATKIEARAQMD